MGSMFWSVSIGLHKTGVHSDFLSLKAVVALLMISPDLHWKCMQTWGEVLATSGTVVANNQTSCDDFCLGSLFRCCSILKFSKHWVFNSNCDCRHAFLNLHVGFFCVYTGGMDWASFTDGTRKNIPAKVEVGGGQPFEAEQSRRRVQAWTNWLCSLTLGL